MNKLSILIAAFLLTIQFSNAQTSAGSQTAGFNFGFNSGKTTEAPGSQYTLQGSPFASKNSTFSFGPSYSHFIANGLDIGVMLDFASTTETNSDNNFGYPLKYTNYQFDGILYARKYFLYKDKFGIRTGPYIGYSKSTTKSTYALAENLSDNNYDSHNINAGLRLDLVYFASKRLGFTAALANLQYEHYILRGSNQLNENANNVSLYTGTAALQISIFYVFGSKG